MLQGQHDILHQVGHVIKHFQHLPTLLLFHLFVNLKKGERKKILYNLVKHLKAIFLLHQIIFSS
jgi:hypothetical protein